MTDFASLPSVPHTTFCRPDQHINRVCGEDTCTSLGGNLPPLMDKSSSCMMTSGEFGCMFPANLTCLVCILRLLILAPQLLLLDHVLTNCVECRARGPSKNYCSLTMCCESRAQGTFEATAAVRRCGVNLELVGTFVATAAVRRCVLNLELVSTFFCNCCCLTMCFESRACEHLCCNYYRLV